MAQGNIFDIVTAEAIAAYYDKLKSNSIPYMGAGLFPAKKKQGLRLEWIRGYESLPIMLQPSAFDAKPLLRDRGGISMENIKMPFFRESARIGEEERQQLLQFKSEFHGAYADAILEKIFDDVTGLVESAEVNAEVMRMGLLGNDGKFTIATPNPDGQAVSYDYDYGSVAWAAKNKTALTGTAAWSDHTNSNPINDLMDAKRKAQKIGKDITRAIIGYDTMRDICENANVKASFFAGNYAGSPLNTVNYANDNAIIAHVSALTGIRIAMYEKTYKDFYGYVKNFFPAQGYIALFGEGNLGNTWYGTTPEEADLMAGNSDAQCRLVNNGVAICTKKESLPVNVITWVSEIVLPSYEKMDDVYAITY